MDVRSAASLHTVPAQLRLLREQGVAIMPIFLDASTDTLVRRFSETRRLHPLSRPDLSDQRRALVQAIELERELVGELREHAHVIDSSMIRSSQLQLYIKELIQAPAAQLTLVFESFAFKHGVPLDADFVFDLRVLPNPFYIKDLRPFTGRDAAVARFMEEQPEAGELLTQIETFLRRWIPGFESDQRSYLTVALGCTGGQHRSVYGVELLARRFKDRNTTLVRHRELDTGE
jgi:UPF0042 nucleotide-binding protein